MTPSPVLAQLITPSEVWIMATGACCAAACATVGCFLVLRRMSLLGDAISHAILPGLAVAFMISGSRAPGPMLLGALVVGLLTAALTSLLGKSGRMSDDSAMGVVFSSLFALGVILISFVAANIDLDPSCVLYGVLETTPLDTLSVAGLIVPRALATLVVILTINCAFVTLLRKELTILCFDPALATTMGLSAGVVHYLLMAAVASTAVASFEAVGSILVVSMLVAPPATAYLLTDRLGRMVQLAVGLGVLSAVIGTALAIRLNVSVAGLIATCSGVLFVLAAAFAPAHGVLAKFFRRIRLSARIAREDLLGELYRAEERATPPALVTAPISAAPWIGALAQRSARRHGWITRSAHGLWGLTESGREQARALVRSHRLWESFLHAHTPLPLDHLHEPSHRVEHFLGEDLRRELEQELRAAQDPHGAAIPSPEVSEISRARTTPPGT